MGAPDGGTAHCRLIPRRVPRPLPEVPSRKPRGRGLAIASSHFRLRSTPPSNSARICRPATTLERRRYVSCPPAVSPSFCREPGKVFSLHVGGGGPANLPHFVDMGDRIHLLHIFGANVSESELLQRASR